MFDSDSSMEIIQLVFGIFVLITIKFLIFRVVFDYFRRNRLNKEDLKYDRIRHVYRKLKKKIDYMLINPASFNILAAGH